jgi:hypothetical protein
MFDRLVNGCFEDSKLFWTQVMVNRRVLQSSVMGTACLDAANSEAPNLGLLTAANT